MCTTHDQYICGFYPAMNIINMHTNLVVCKHAISLEVCCHTYSESSTPNTVFKTHSTIRCDNTPMAYQTFTHQIWWVMACYDLAHQIRCAKHTFRGRCDITPMVCCSFGGHSTPQFLQCMFLTIWHQDCQPFYEETSTRLLHR